MTPQQLQAMKQALEAMESVTVECNNFHHPKKDQNHDWAKCPPVVRWDKAITALEEALAQPEDPCKGANYSQAREQEPVAYTTGHCENHKQKGGCQLHNLQCGWPDCDRKPITTPPQRTWVGLTDEDELDWEEGGSLKDLVKAIEAKLKEKNT